jgi:hypothetical protein
MICGLLEERSDDLTACAAVNLHREEIPDKNDSRMCTFVFWSSVSCYNAILIRSIGAGKRLLLCVCPVFPVASSHPVPPMLRYLVNPDPNAFADEQNSGAVASCIHDLIEYGNIQELLRREKEHLHEEKVRPSRSNAHAEYWFELT